MGAAVFSHWLETRFGQIRVATQVTENIDLSLVAPDRQIKLLRKSPEIKVVFVTWRKVSFSPSVETDMIALPRDFERYA